MQQNMLTVISSEQMEKVTKVRKNLPKKWLSKNTSIGANIKLTLSTPLVQKQASEHSDNAITW
jgi:hypothetical protein